MSKALKRNFTQVYVLHREESLDNSNEESHFPVGAPSTTTPIATCSVSLIIQGDIKLDRVKLSP